MRRMSRRRKSTLISALVVIAAAVCTYFFMGDSILSSGKDEPSSPAVSAPAPAEDGELQIQYLDVDQADAALIYLPNGQIMMIDAGGNATADALTEYMKNQGIEKIDYLVGTHPHEDHIGGLDRVIESFDIGSIYLPKIPDSQVPTTKTYEDVLTAVEDKGLTVQQGKGGVSIFQSEGLSAEILAPNQDSYEEMNNYSIVVMLTYQEKKFLFMGDAEVDSEEEILKQYSVKADVLKCGHHGSSTSTSREFLQQVVPQYAVISCGVDNSYGHPHSETIKALQDQGAAVYRTDEQHTIIAVCDGKEIGVSAADVQIR